MARGISLHFAVSTPGPGCCETSTLASPRANAATMADIARKKGFWVREPLLDSRVDSHAVLRALRGAACELEPADILLLTFAGHGCEATGLRPAFEPKDQGWCLTDRLFLDNELDKALEAFQPGVRILIVSDSCHSRTISGGPFLPKEAPAGHAAFAAMRDARAEQIAADWGLEDECRLLVLPTTPHPENRIQASVIVLAASLDHQNAREVSGVALFTTALKAVTEEDRFETYCGFMNEISGRVSLQRPTQVPAMGFAGIPNPAFARQRPFTI